MSGKHVYQQLRKIYKDPPDAKKFISELKRTKMVQDILTKCNELFIKKSEDGKVIPGTGWYLTTCKQYSNDYAFLTENWNKIVQKSRYAKMRRGIVIVSFIPTTEKDHTILKFVMDMLTCIGFVVRSTYEMTYCRICNDVIPTQVAYNVMKDRSLPVPSRWQLKCIDC